MGFLRNDTKPATVVDHYVKYKSSEKQFSYWDKEKKESVPVDLSKGFIVLDKKYSFSGYDGEENIWSNEIRNFKSENMVVFIGKEKIADGTYQQIKETAKAKGANFTICLYVTKIDEPETIYHVALSKGAATGAWDKKLNKVVGLGGWNMLNINDSQEYAYVKDYEEYIFKATKQPYYVPVFDKKLISHDQTIDIDKVTSTALKLKDYFEALKEYQKTLSDIDENYSDEDGPSEEADMAEEVFLKEQQDKKPDDLPF